MNHGTFATAICCGDGRTHRALEIWTEKRLGTTPVYLDKATKPGCDKFFKDFTDDAVSAIKHDAEIYVRAHSAKIVIVAGHDQCAGNPVSKEQHWDDVRKGVEIVRSWNFGVSVVGLWVYEKRTGEWIAEVVVDRE